MSVFILVQITINIVLFLSSLVLWLRFLREPKDDPRLTRGLQLLQSKIAVLEDLSDRTDVQVKQLSQLLEQKGKEVQERIAQADRQVQIVKNSMDKSLEVAKIFQDKIPHQEIIERQNTAKYVKAARMAHEGKSIDEIAQVVDLNRGELELIAKLNRNTLMFAADDLPAWLNEERVPGPELYMEDKPTENRLAEYKQTVQRDLSQAFVQPQSPSPSLQKLGEDFRKACRDMETKTETAEKVIAKAPAFIRQADQWAEDLANNMVKRLAGNQVFQRAMDALSAEHPSSEISPSIEISGAPKAQFSIETPEPAPGYVSESPQFSIAASAPQADIAPSETQILQKDVLRPRQAGVEPVVFRKLNLNDTLR